MQKTYREGFQLDNDGAGLRIVAVDYHTKPLYLDQAALAEIGLQLRDDHQLKYDPAKAKKGEQLIESLVTTLQRVADLAASQKEPAKWKWDLENLRKLQLLVAGLEETALAELLDAENGAS